MSQIPPPGTFCQLCREEAATGTTRYFHYYKVTIGGAAARWKEIPTCADCKRQHNTWFYLGGPPLRWVYVIFGCIALSFAGLLFTQYMVFLGILAILVGICLIGGHIYAFIRWRQLKRTFKYTPMG